MTPLECTADTTAVPGKKIDKFDKTIKLLIPVSLYLLRGQGLALGAEAQLKLGGYVVVGDELGQVHCDRAVH